MRKIGTNFLMKSGEAFPLYFFKIEIHLQFGWIFWGEFPRIFLRKKKISRRTIERSVRFKSES